MNGFCDSWFVRPLFSSPSLRRQSRRACVWLAVPFVASLSGGGCTDAPPRADGPDMPFLNASLAEEPSSAPPQMPLLPLVKGATWKMVSLASGKKHQEAIVVTGPITENGLTGIQVETQRGGKRWRREVYQQNANGTLLLAGMQDENSELIRLVPPVPIARRPCRDGDHAVWNGKFIMGQRVFAATGYSRASAREVVTTPAGRFKTYRLDTILIVGRYSSHELRFPSARWLAPGFGFVRRGFAEQGHSAFSEVTSFSLP